MRTDVTPSMVGYAKGLAAAANQRACALALEADEAITQAETSGWMDAETGRAIDAADASDAALGDAIDAGRHAWEAERMLAGGGQAAVEDVPRPEYEAEAS